MILRCVFYLLLGIALALLYFCFCILSPNPLALILDCVCLRFFVWISKTFQSIPLFVFLVFHFSHRFDVLKFFACIL